MILIDQLNRRVVLNNFPQRIISLVPSQTELLFYLTEAEKVVGITRFCIHPKEHFLKTAKIGGTKEFDFDKIDALKPDLIIGNKEENYLEGIEKLSEKYPVWMSDINSVEDALSMIKELGIVLNQSSKARHLAEQIAHHFYLFEAQKKWNKNKTIAYFIWKKPLMVAASNNYIDDILSKMGFVNVFAHKKSRYPEISEAELMTAQPEFIFLSSEPYPFKEKHLSYFNEICPKSKVIIVDGEMFSWYGNRMLLAGDYLLKLKKELIMCAV